MARATFRFVHHLVGVHEIAEMLDVSRQRVDQLTARDDFPPPAAILHAGRRIWNRPDVEAWARATGRLTP
jgi:predicted DNA-binding transcriptional regulator AlpA